MRATTQAWPLLICFWMLFPFSGADHLVGDDWMRFLGGEGRATVDQADLPMTWGDDANLLWKIDLPGPGASSPIVVGNKIFLTCYTGYGITGAVDKEATGDITALTRHLLCFDRNNGQELWRRSVDNQSVQDEDPFKGYITAHGYATNTPVSDGETVFAFFGKAGLFAWNLEGEPVWNRQFESSKTKYRWGSAASPFLVGDQLIVNAIDECGKIYSLNKQDGSVRWEYETGSRMAYSVPGIAKSADGAQELVIAIPEKVVALDPATGKEKWFAKTTLMNEVNASVVVEGDIVYIYGGYQGVGSLAIRCGGSGDVTQSHVLWSKKETSYVATPSLVDGHLYWLDKSGIAHCVDAKSGEVVYKQRVPGVKGGRGVKFFASPVRIGNRLLALSRESGAFVLAAKPEFELLAHNTIESDESAFNGTPAIVDNRMYLRSNRCLYCIGK